MRVTRINKRPNLNKNLTKPKQPRRKIKRYVKESEIPAVTSVTNALNAPGTFTYSDIRRNFQSIEMIRHQINQAIFNYGQDLQYFRRYNTFFKDDETEENHANLIYGEDTTAEFYASGMIRAYVSIDNMAWNFNQIGLEAAEQITIYVSIDNFEQAFQDKIAKVEERMISVPVYGDTRNYEVTGMIVEPEFQAKVYAQFDDDFLVRDSILTVVPKEIDRNFYKSLAYQKNEHELTGSLKGTLHPHPELPFEVSGVLRGKVKFHGSKNLEDAEIWKNLAPQVGDYFKLTLPTGINEEWEINQVYDKNFTKNGLNPLLGKYVYQMIAVRRVASHEKNTLELEVKNPGEDIEEILGMIHKDPEEDVPDPYVEKKKKNVRNKKTNKLGHNVYKYEDREDETYGGVQNKPNSK